MIQLGEYQTLSVSSIEDHGHYLADDEENDVLMPTQYVTEGLALGDSIEVFVYSGSGDLDIATTEKPYFTCNQFAYLEVTDANQFGAFCNWGVSKELLIPFHNQKTKLGPGDQVVVYLYLDEITDRLVGTTKLKSHLLHSTDTGLTMGEEVSLLFYAKTDLGYKAIINHTYAGLVYHNEALRPIQLGDTMQGYIKPARPDGKIDLSLSPIGHRGIDVVANRILEVIKEQGGQITVTDKSPPAEINRVFGISKKLFKKSIGHLYKKRLISISNEGIHLSL